ncbi:20215_t:CDS:1, partial [Racocetra persica]
YDRSSVYRNRLNLTDDTHYRETSSRLINCSFKLSAASCKNIWYLKVLNSDYIHEALTDMSGYPIVRRLNVKQKEIVKQIAAAGSHPHEILSTIHQNDQSSIAISKTVYNVMYSIHQERFNSCTLVQALLD